MPNRVYAVAVSSVLLALLIGLPTLKAQSRDFGKQDPFWVDQVKIGLPENDDEGDDEGCDCPPYPTGVPATGQTECWDASGNPIACASTGQDGEYQTGLSVDPRYTDVGDGTIIDNLTGLIWSKDANCFGQQIWTTALTSANTLAGGSCGLMDGSVAGDWRLPTIKELQSLFDYGEWNPALLPAHPFLDVQSSRYWSSTTIVDNPTRAWSAYFFNGYSGYDSKSNAYFVWPVRNSQ